MMKSTLLFLLAIIVALLLIYQEQIYAKQARNTSTTNTPKMQIAAQPALESNRLLSAAPAVTATNILTYEGTPVGFTANGFPYRGDPKAPLTLLEYSDYLCPFCGRHFAQSYPTLIEKYVKTGVAQLVFHDFPIASLHPTAPIGHQAARCVAEQGAVPFWRMHDALFRHQAEWNAMPDPREFLAGLAKESGVKMAAYTKCMAAGKTATQVAQSINEGEKVGFNATPSFLFINNSTAVAYTLVGAHPMETFAQWLDALAAGQEPPKEPEPAKPELPFWAKPEGLAPDPKRPGFTLAGDQYKGSPEAKVTVVEFSDFQCPACGVFARETQPLIEQTFVDTGEIRWVFKHFPLRMHPQAPAAAVAAECAADQGKFWEMHALLFKDIERWGVEDIDVALSELATDLALNKPIFQRCLDSRKALERVLADLYDVQGVVESTPTFIVLYGGTGTVIRGAYSSTEFIAYLQKFLEPPVNEKNK